MTFWSDLDHMLSDYDANERAGETERAMTAEDSDYAVNGERANLVPECMVLAPWLNDVRVSGEGRETRILFLPGSWDDPWGRDA